MVHVKPCEIKKKHFSHFNFYNNYNVVRWGFFPSKYEYELLTIKQCTKLIVLLLNTINIQEKKLWKTIRNGKVKIHVRKITAQIVIAFLWRRLSVYTRATTRWRLQLTEFGYQERHATALTRHELKTRRVFVPNIRITQ